MIADLVRRTRTVRRFQGKRILNPALFNFLIDPARLDGSVRNAQCLKFMVLIGAKRGWHGEHKVRHPPKHSLSRMLMTPSVAV